jgi:hypothetical protein
MYLLTPPFQLTPSAAAAIKLAVLSTPPGDLRALLLINAASEELQEVGDDISVIPDLLIARGGAAEIEGIMLRTPVGYMLGRGVLRRDTEVGDHTVYTSAVAL